ncbi:F-box domain-containing protein [Rutstroemia sp. NJR-2017a BBW]|nr:F-box domain-containing protein [Rutstroemia sp. NJR-2017a BBW]
MFGLISLPYEVLSNIIAYIDFEDVFNLGQTCQALKFLTTEESICKYIIQTKLPFSAEALSTKNVTGRGASALRQAAKRRAALATASPYSLATVGFGDAYFYCNGVLCYTLDDRLRILEIHNSAQDEFIVSIPAIVNHATEEGACNTSGFFEVLYYSDKIVSCLYRTTGLDANAWLIAFCLEPSEVIVVKELESTTKIFVRHDGQFLFYGTHSELGTDGNKKWAINGYSFESRKWFDKKVHLPDMVGSEIGSTICFEIHDGYFYALSNQTSFEVEEIDWTSFYHCVRFPLASPCIELLERTDDKSMWRRQHQEGPIDDRWTNLRLDKDESSGALRIVESRKEWYYGSSRSQRTYYTTPIVFPELFHEPGDGLDFSADDLALSTPVGTSASPSFQSGSSSMSDQRTPLTDYSEFNYAHDLTSLPDDPLTRLLRKDDKPNHMLAPLRLPQYTHPGNDGSSNRTFTLTKSRLRHYDTSSSTYLDIVDDPLPSDWEGKQRLRLRAGSRRLGPPLFYPSDHPSKAGLQCSPPQDLDTALSVMYRQSDVTFWPPEQDPEVPDEGLDELYRLLNPPTHLGNVEGTADERSLVYMTGGLGKPQAIILISFDPAIKLAGLKRWGGMRRKGVGEGPHIDGRASGNGEKGCAYAQAADKVVGIDRKGKGKQTASSRAESPADAHTHELPPMPAASNSTSAATGARGSSKRKHHWIWKEKAMYRDIGLGFYFGLDRPGESLSSA